VFLDNQPENYSSTGMFAQRHARIFMEKEAIFLSSLPIILSSFSYLFILEQNNNAFAHAMVSALQVHIP